MFLAFQTQTMSLHDLRSKVIPYNLFVSQESKQWSFSFSYVRVFFGGWRASPGPAAFGPQRRTCPPSHRPPGGNESADCWERLVCWEGSAAFGTERWSAAWTWGGRKRIEEWGGKCLHYLNKQLNRYRGYCILRLCRWDRSCFQWLPRVRYR